MTFKVLWCTNYVILKMKMLNVRLAIDSSRVRIFYRPLCSMMQTHVQWNCICFYTPPDVVVFLNRHYRQKMTPIVLLQWWWNTTQTIIMSMWLTCLTCYWYLHVRGLTPNKTNFEKIKMKLNVKTKGPRTAFCNTLLNIL